MCVFFFFFKQKTAYEMRISEWSSDVCSSDLTIDEEVRKIIEANYATAKSIIVGNLDKLHAMAAALLKYETIDIEQIKRIFAGQDPGEPERWNNDGPRSNGGGGGPAATPAVGGLTPTPTTDRMSPRLNSRHSCPSRMPS